ncbi:uncharacterized protein LOC121253559 [Juglans microcarpa x Juglans regia]|uniref:uncharacterized protein LOC121253559 n=1 Tax=Juglans microcarpa x Juglans regia TaxID=2249226 RepID=UPI001B7ECB00|nr:uncharacterized protein LOC121253559 [Juglans microcarpa x Juglans regia]
MKDQQENNSHFLNFSNPNNPYRVDSGDNTTITLIIDLLTSENYVIWSLAMRWALRARNKLGFINGTLIRLASSEDPLFNACDRCNDMVGTWIQNSISAIVKSSVAFVENAQDIWDELRDHFTQQNGPRIFQLKMSLASLQQEQDPVNIYYGKLKTL